MLERDKCVFALIDVQGKLAQSVRHSKELHRQLHKLISAWPLFERPLLWVEQLPDKLGQTSESLQALLSDYGPAIAKGHFSAMANEQFVQALSDSHCQQVVLAGIETHICVYQTCRDLLQAGFEVFIVVDAMSSRSKQDYLVGIQMMQAMGAQIHTVESLLFELQHEASGERFKQLLNLIK
ncbi:isochorismatase family protein [Shewanella sp. NIFS-20-20]|uniref:isochorismatase family protein n=1 Tax=Shewanella sp. NIFS-20-20 TaxID=2853806 RepID=UPI001C483AAC|nr:isochorismatase family protein [Shewanella sp. NIFS-20-20]MBV7314662.1 isochorismatase family protein [Shewanella sp. NIFS-20-20]